MQVCDRQGCPAREAPAVALLRLGAEPGSAVEVVHHDCGVGRWWVTLELCSICNEPADRSQVDNMGHRWPGLSACLGVLVSLAYWTNAGVPVVPPGSGAASADVCSGAERALRALAQEYDSPSARRAAASKLLNDWPGTTQSSVVTIQV